MKVQYVLLGAVLAGLLASCASNSSVQSGDINQAASLLTADGCLVDVRTAEEYAGGHLTGAVNVPKDIIDGAEDTVDTLPDKNQQLLIYCRSGVRSKAAAQKLVSLGYTNVTDLGGILSWNGETVTGSSPM